MRPALATIHLNDEKIQNIDVVVEQNSINICSDCYLPNPKSAISLTNCHKHLDYNTHSNLSNEYALNAASYILVLLIIPSC